MLTIPFNDWSVPANLPQESDLLWIKGQQEIGTSTTNYRHWQIIVGFSKKKTLAQVKESFCDTAHCEVTRSKAADSYVWKEESAVPGTRFELGSKPLRRNDDRDWKAIWDNAKSGDFEQIPEDVRIRCYSNLRRIHADYSKPTSQPRYCTVFWGPTGLGKSFRAWNQAGLEAFSKDPRTKFWDGYQGQECVVIDEFRGDIAVNHLLRWLDCYPVNLEIKGSSTPLRASKFWITSNLHPNQWYPDLDYETYQALERRLKIIQILSIDQEV